MGGLSAVTHVARHAPATAVCCRCADPWLGIPWLPQAASRNSPNTGRDFYWKRRLWPGMMHWPIRESAMVKGLLLAAFDFSTAHADEFHDWYDLEHIPERRAVAGFGACERWIGEEQPAVSVATYDLDSIDVLHGEAYGSIAYSNLSVWSK